MKKQLERMHMVYGKSHVLKCGTCCNFVRDRYHDRMLQKCERYGLTHSEASDWAQSWEACGMHNVPLPENERPMIERCKGTREATYIENIPGQVGLFTGGEATE
jgi:hypothetical protein